MRAAVSGSMSVAVISFLPTLVCLCRRDENNGGIHRPLSSSKARPAFRRPDAVWTFVRSSLAGLERVRPKAPTTCMTVLNSGLPVSPSAL